MALPDWTYVSLSGTLLEYDGTPATGRLQFAPSTQLVHTIDMYTVVTIPMEVAVDPNGFFSVSLPATDNVNIDPQDWLWMITERLTGRPDRVHFVQLPSTTPVVNYADLVVTGEFNEFSD